MDTSIEGLYRERRTEDWPIRAKELDNIVLDTLKRMQQAQVTYSEYEWIRKRLSNRIDNATRISYFA